MTGDQLMAAFEVLAEAPEGVKRLRELVLSLAVRGKLVAQDPGEGSAGGVLADVAKEKGNLARSGRLKVREDGPIRNGEVPFPVANSWLWAPLAAVTIVVTDGDHQPPPRAEDGFPFVVIGNVSGGQINLSDTRLVPSSYFAALDWTKKPTLGDLLYTVTGSLGLVIRVGDEPPFCVQRHIGILKTARGVETSFLCSVLRSPYAQRYAAEVATGIAQKTLPLSGLRCLPVPVPPLAEQHRIVARVDELMGLLDRLEAARTARDDVRRAARDAALAALRDAENTDAVEAAWGRIARQMDALFVEPEDVGPLRQAVLGLAVRGRLTEDDASTWMSTTLGSILVDGPTNGWSPRAVEHPTGVMSLKLSATTRGYFDGSHFKHVDPEGELDERLWLRPDDLLIQRSNTPEYVGTAAVFDGPPRTFIYPDLMMRCRVAPKHDVRFVHLAISAPTVRAWISAKASGTSKSMVKVNQATVASIPVQLPPRDRQVRIVAAASTYFQLCDTLESRLTTARDLHAQFAASAVHHLDV